MAPMTLTTINGTKTPTMRINYTNHEGKTYELKGDFDPAGHIASFLDPTFDTFGGPTSVVVHHADGTTETYERRPEDPKRYTVELRAPQKGDRFFAVSDGQVTVTVLKDPGDVTFGPRPVIVEEL